MTTLDPMIVPCTCSRPPVENGIARPLEHFHGCPRDVATKHPNALFEEHDTFAVLYPGTLCEWPTEGHGSGRGRGGVFICKHCGQGHNDHGLGDSYVEIHERFKTPENRKHQVCKIFISKPTTISAAGPDMQMIALSTPERRLLAACIDLAMSALRERDGIAEALGLQTATSFEAIQRMTELMQRIKP